MTDTERRAMLDGVMTAVHDYAAIKMLAAVDLARGKVHLVPNTGVEQAAVAFAIAVLEAVIHADGPLVTALAVEWEGWRSIAEEMRR